MGTEGVNGRGVGNVLERPNIIVVMCDQLRSFEVGCYGNDVIRTPHIDRLAVEGVRFEHAVSNNPVCMAARSCLLSGQYSRTCNGFLGNYKDPGGPDRFNVPEYPEEARRFLVDPTLPEQLKAVGYETTLIGKWHVQPSPPQTGFDYSLYPRVHHRHTGQTFVENMGEGELVDGFSVDYESRAVADYLNSVAGQDKPFFLFYSISPPHMPLDDAPEEYLRMYAPEEVPLRDNVWRADGSLPYDEDWFKIYLWDFIYYQEHEAHTEHLPEGFTLRHLIARYYGLTSWVDDMVGRLTAGLQTHGLDRDTIILFISDHGDNLGSHGLFNKGRLIEESIRVPMVWHCPSRWRSRVCEDGVASLVDVMPTVLELAGAQVPDSVQGHSLVPALCGDGPAPDQAFIETTRGDIGVRTTSHTYGMRLDEDERRITETESCFYDLRQDPYQLDDIPGAQRKVAADLRARLEAWHAEMPWHDVEM